uniref:VWFA domain-containing protein n=1 Tax=Panagrolaimus davidi TaxID=227884 RepID=A0A914Q5P1_9BILA
MFLEVSTPTYFTQTPTDFTTESPGPTETPGPDHTTSPPPQTPTPSTPPPPTVATTQNTGPTNCYGLIFAGEMSQSITLQEKTNFLNIVLQIARNFQNTNLKFAITTFGIKIYQNLNDFQSYNEFVSTVNGLIAGLPLPNSALTYIAPVLDDIYDDLILYNGKGISTLFMGEMEAIRDPNAGYTAALRVASTGKNVYVLDYSSGSIPASLWPYLTNNHFERIINGTGYDATTIYNNFYSTLITDINNNIC